MHSLLRVAKVCVPLLLALFLAAPLADAQNVSTQNATACGPSSQCVGTTPYSLADILNGSEVLTIPPNGSPGWLVVNDTGSALTSLKLIFNGTFASNAQLNCQSNGAFAGGDWTCTVNGTSNGIKSPGDTDTITWTFVKGNGIASGEDFDITTSSFAAAGQDTGCLSGTGSCIPTRTPEPSALTLLLAGLVLGGIGFGFRRRLGFGA